MKRSEFIMLFLCCLCAVSAQDVITNDSIVDKSKLIVLPDSLLDNSETEGDIFDLMNDDDLKPMDQPLSKSDSVKQDSTRLKDVDPVRSSIDSIISLHPNMAMPVLDVNDTLLIDTLGIDSLGLDYQNLDSLNIDSLLNTEFDIDSLNLDSLVIDSVILDSMAIDSTYEMQRKLFVRDSLRLDSIRRDSIREDSLRLKAITDKYKAKQYRSIAELQRMIYRFRKDYKAALKRWDDYYLTLDEVRMKPEYYKYVVPLTYYSSAIRQAGNIDGWMPEDIFSKKEKETEEKLNAMLPDLRVSKKMEEEVERQLLSFYVHYPKLVKRNEAEFANVSVLSNKDLEAGPRNENILNMAQVSNKVGGVSESDLVVYRPNFWTTGGSGFLQFSQNHISDNWYKGGESNKSLFAGLALFANFNDTQRIQFENKLEWKLGFISTPSDTLHSYKPNNDIIRLNSKLGLKAVKHWYYTLSVDFKTQFFSNYKTNSKDVISAFFSPAELNVGLGMDYKFVKDATCNLSVLINPLNYTLYSVASDDVDPTKFNIKAGHKHESVLGSRMEATLKWKVFKMLMWESRLSYSTNYEKALADWENTFTFVVNKYLSTKLFVNARFDDGVPRKEGKSYFQLQEILSFGLNYTW